MRLEARPSNSLYGGWEVLDSEVNGSRRIMLQGVTEDEAKTAAWAWSMKASGHDLYSRPRVFNGHVPHGAAQYTKFLG